MNLENLFELAHSSKIIVPIEIFEDPINCYIRKSWLGV